MQPHDDNTHDDTQRFTVSGAAEALGITAEAVRQRIRRGTLRSEKDESGSVFVFLAPDKYPPYGQSHADATQHDGDYTNNKTVDYTELVEALRDQVASLKNEVEAWREEARRKDHLLAAALERIPAIEAPQDAPQDAPQAPEKPTEREGRVETPLDTERRSWLYRFFFGP